MRDPYLYSDVNVLVNRAGIKNAEVLRKAEADITNLAMTAIYEKNYEKFNAETLCDIHRLLFGQIYDWAGEFRTIWFESFARSGKLTPSVRVTPAVLLCLLSCLQSISALRWIMNYSE